MPRQNVIVLDGRTRFNQLKEEIFRVVRLHDLVTARPVAFDRLTTPCRAFCRAGVGASYPRHLNSATLREYQLCDLDLDGKPLSGELSERAENVQ